MDEGGRGWARVRMLRLIVSSAIALCALAGLRVVEADEGPRPIPGPPAEPSRGCALEQTLPTDGPVQPN